MPIQTRWRVDPMESGPANDSPAASDHHSKLDQPQQSQLSEQYQEFLKRFLWNGGSTFDAWLNASSFQVSQVLLNFPYSFAQMGMASGIFFQILYAFMGWWVSYIMTSLFLSYRNLKQRQNCSLENHSVQFYEVLDGLLGPWGKIIGLVTFFLGLSSAAMIQIISCASSAYYINDKLDKRTWTLVLGPCLFLAMLIPTPRNYRMWSFAGIVMTTYVAWYLTIAAAIHRQVPGVQHTGPRSMVHFFTGAANILYASGGHGLTVEIAGSMWKPSKFKQAYFYAVLYVLTLTVPSASTVYWAFGDRMLHNTNAFAVLPRTRFRDAAVVLIILHQFFEFGLLALPLCFMFEKLFGVHHSRHYIVRAATRVPLFLALWLCAIMLPFFGPIDSVNGSLLTGTGVYVLPCLTHMIVNHTASARKNAVEKPPSWMGWVGVYCVNLGISLWILVVGVGFGGWASISNLGRYIHQFGLFVKCYQCQVNS